jgi:multicomponent Na+:H+ antiporter subunit E
MTLLLLNLLLALAWVALTGEFTPLNLGIGFALGFAALWLTRRNGDRPGYVRKVGIVVSFSLFFLWELLLANLRMAIVLLRPHRNLQPGIVAVPLELDSDLGVTLLANLITLTPGTLALDVSSDRTVMYVHGVDVRDVDTFRYEIKHGFERRIKELLA